jgi:hypothetical protein
MIKEKSIVFLFKGKVKVIVGYRIITANIIPLSQPFFRSPICWSGAIELLQPFVNRYGEFQDLAANIIGLVCGLLAAKLIRWLL